jgi:nitrogen regulatory protein PII
MKRIEAVIRPHKQAYVLAALARLGITNVTIIETLGLCDPPNYSQIYDPANVDAETGTGLVPKRLLLLFVEDDQVQPVLELIQTTALTGRPGDGIIAVSQLDQILRIRPKGEPQPPR